MNSEFEEKEQYVFIDFNDKVGVEIAHKSQHFFRIADLDTTNPLIQLNDVLYKGTYEDCIGTNLFFIEVDDSPTNQNCFEKETSVSLKYLLSQSKILNMKCVKIENTQTESFTDHTLKMNLNQDYQTCLKKLGDGALNIEDLIEKNPVEPVVDNKLSESKPEEQNVTIERTKTPVEITMPENLDEEQVNSMETEEFETESTEKFSESFSQEPVDLEEKLDQLPIEEPIKEQTANHRLLRKYEKLKQLARRPVHREIEPEIVMECDEKYKRRYEYHNIERQIFQRGDSFPIIMTDLSPSNLKEHVDVDRSILHDIIKPQIIEKMNDSIMNKLLRIENFEFLSLPARLAVLETELEHLKEFVRSSSENNLKEVDEFGRMPKDTLAILEKLVAHLKKYLNIVKNSSEKTLDVS